MSRDAADAADPGGAETRCQQRRHQRGVITDPGPDGVGEMWARLDNDALLRWEQQLDQVAGWLKKLGDEDDKDVRRATALARCADPEAVRRLWARVWA